MIGIHAEKYPVDQNWRLAKISPTLPHLQSSLMAYPVSLALPQQKEKSSKPLNKAFLDFLRVGLFFQIVSREEGPEPPSTVLETLLYH